MRPRVMKVTLWVVLSVTASASALAATGRTPGTFDVSASGTATYVIPIWIPPGPRGVQPSLALAYDSGSGNGTVGVGWSLTGLSAIERCGQTIAQDGVRGAVSLTSADKFCLSGNRLRLQSGTYGASGSTYFTEFADYSYIQAVGTAGDGPQHFIVKRKDGLIYEYGNSSNSRVLPGTSSTASKWMLSKVSDLNGNNYVINYYSANGVAVPSSIDWTPTSHGASTYRYRAEFGYSTKESKDSIRGYVATQSVLNDKRLETITIKSGGSTVRKYRLQYETAPVTELSRLTSVTECADDAESDCLAPTTMTYQMGQVGVRQGASAPGSGAIPGSYDFNADGKDDLVYASSGSIFVALSSNSGFEPARNTQVASANAYVIGAFLAKGHDSFLVNQNGTLIHSRWNPNTSAFEKVSTGVTHFSTSSVPEAADTDGDGRADLVWLQTTAQDPNSVWVRRNTSAPGATVPTFVTTPALGTRLNETWWSSPGNRPWTASDIRVEQAPGWGIRYYDVNGDGRQDLHVTAVVMTSPTGATAYSFTMLSFGNSFSVPPASSWVWGGQNTALHFNDDRCTDRWGKQLSGSTQIDVIFVSQCNSSPAFVVPVPNTPAQPVVFTLDWDGDGRSDVLVQNGSTLAVRRSTGAGFAALQTTDLPVGSYFWFDQDGDGMADLARLNGSAAITYYTHTSTGTVTLYATHIPDLLTSVSDGFGVRHEIDYTTTAQGSYSPGDATQAPLVPLPEPKVIIARVTSTDGTGGTYRKTYSYAGARIDQSRGGFAGFQRVEEVDSRTQFIRRTHYEQAFPNMGAVKKVELLRADGTTPISVTEITNSHAVLDSTANNQRYFLYASARTTRTYEVGGEKDGQLIKTTTTAIEQDDIDLTYGNMREVTTTVTDNDSSSPDAGGQWVTRTITTFHSANTSNWCIALPTQEQVVSSATGVPSITRTVQYTPDVTNCRYSAKIIEPTSSTLRVDTSYGYDDFGNVDSIVVVGRNPDGSSMSSRTSSLDWGTSGQFAMRITNPLGHVTDADYDFDLGLQSSQTDPNGLVTEWDYDAFGRRILETRPDGTQTSWAYAGCGGACMNERHKMTIVQTTHGSNGSTLSDQIAYVDQFDRVLVTRTRLLAGGYQWNELQYDALGRANKRGIPCATSNAVPSCVTSWQEFGYDDLGRPSWARRAVNASDSTWQTTTFSYAGGKTAVTDPQGKISTKVVDVNGRLRRTTDANGYYQSFVYDAAGSLKAVIDSEQRQRFSAEYVYGADAYQIETSDPDLGSRTQEYDSLGQLRHWTNAEDQHFYATYDPLSRPLTRTEPDHSSGWVWGNDANLHNIGRLQSVSSTANGATYQESFVYDALARLATRTITIPGDNSYQYAYAYNAVNGALDVITYPVSTSSYRLRVKHNYTSAGILQSISDADVPATVFWTANEVDARGWVTQETLGNGIVIRRTYDPITGWLSSIQSGTSGNPAAVQNTSYLYDLVGNVTQRQNNNLGLTENFYYGSPVDNLYRLSYSTLNGTTNLSLTYDELGNILTKNEPGHHDLTIDHAVAWTSYNYPSQISALGETASFEYGPSRQRWKMMYSGIGGNETTYYIGGMMEKVVRGSTSDYRHYVTAGGRAVALYTRRSDGQNALRYALGDHQGSVETITNSDGSVLENASFTAYGNRRSSETWSGAPSATERANLDEVTRQGYTFQTVLGMMGMNHMNGRVQDSITGRFLSPDPFITNPGYTQNYNRYSYVYNNPLTYSDPTGFAVKNKDCGREGSGCQPTPEEIQEIINASTTTVVVNGSRINPFQRAYWTAWDLNRAASLATGVLLTPSFEEGGASDATSEEPIDEVITEAKKCTVSDFVKDLINALKEQLWKNARLDFAVSVDAMWGAGNAQEGSFSHYATSFGVNTFGQFYVQQQGSSSLNGAGAIAAAEVGGEVGVGMGPLTGGPPQTVATGAFSLYALRGFTLGGEVGSQDASLDAPLPEAGSFKPHTGFGFGAATYWGQEREFTLASPPFLGLISPPGDYSGC